MDRTWWHRQAPEKPLHPDLLWSRPQNKRQAGKLLIVGGNVHGFAAAGEAYSQAIKAGIGTARVLLPDSLQKTIGKVFEAGEYAPSTPSGSFAQTAQGELLELAAWADSVLLAGDFGRNSETAIVLEKFVDKYNGRLTLTKDAVDYFIKTPSALLDRVDCLLVPSFAQLQKLAIKASLTTVLTFSMDFLRLVDALHELTDKYQAGIIIKHLQTIFVALNGEVSTTKLDEDLETWRVATATRAAVWWLQNPGKPFEAMTASLAAS